MMIIAFMFAVVMHFRRQEHIKLKKKNEEGLRRGEMREDQKEVRGRG